MRASRSRRAAMALVVGGRRGFSMSVSGSFNERAHCRCGATPSTGLTASNRDERHATLPHNGVLREAGVPLGLRAGSLSTGYYGGRCPTGQVGGGEFACDGSCRGPRPTAPQSGRRKRRRRGYAPKPNRSIVRGSWCGLACCTACLGRCPVRRALARVSACDRRWLTATWFRRDELQVSRCMS